MARGQVAPAGPRSSAQAGARSLRTIRACLAPVPAGGACSPSASGPAKVDPREDLVDADLDAERRQLRPALEPAVDHAAPAAVGRRACRPRPPAWTDRSARSAGAKLSSGRPSACGRGRARRCSRESTSTTTTGASSAGCLAWQLPADDEHVGVHDVVLRRHHLDVAGEDLAVPSLQTLSIQRHRRTLRVMRLWSIVPPVIIQMKPSTRS